MEENENNELLDLYVAEVQSETKITETVDVIDVSDIETYTIETDVAFPAQGDINEGLNHQLLNGREFSDQHPITAITGLREELNTIEALKIVYSNEKKYANYYLWQDGNPDRKNRVGYFVSACQDTDKIAICEDTEIFGVTVDTAGFIGGQSDIERDYTYGLVVHSGLVDVRCEMDIKQGDYVISNDYGVAKKNIYNYGYQVVTIKNIEGLSYATIRLNVSVEKICELADNVIELNSRMNSAEINIANAMNTATQAYSKSVEASEKSQQAEQKSNEAMEKVNTVAGQIAEAERISDQAAKTAADAVAAAKDFQREAMEFANNEWAKANDSVEEMKATMEELQNEVDIAISQARSDAENARDTVDELSTKTSSAVSELSGKTDTLISQMDSVVEYDKDGNLGIRGTIKVVDENGITLGDVTQWQSDINTTAETLKATGSSKLAAWIMDTAQYKTNMSTNMASVQNKATENGAFIDSLALHRSNHSYGDTSPTYGLIDEYSRKEKMFDGFVFIPSTDCRETGEYAYSYDFYKGYYYKWTVTGDKAEWVGSEGAFTVDGITHIDVSFEDEQTNTGNTIASYWAPPKDVTIGDVTYEHDALYKWVVQEIEEKNDNNEKVTKIYSKWEKVAVKNCSGVQSAALIAQEVNDLKSEIDLVASYEKDGKSGMAALRLLATEHDSQFGLIAEHEDNIASISSRVDECEADISILTGLDGSITDIVSKSTVNEARISSLASHISFYFAGSKSPYSTSTLEQHKEVMQDDMVYVPTTTHDETFKCEASIDGNVTYTFTMGFYYKWDSTIPGYQGTKYGGWVKSDNSDDVVFYGQYLSMIKNTPYWVCTASENFNKDDITYEPNTLYKLYSQQVVVGKNDDGTDKTKFTQRWVAVARVDDTMMQSSALITQIANDTKAEIDLVADFKKGDKSGMAALRLQAEESKSGFDLLAQHSFGDATGMAAIIGEVNEHQSSLINLAYWRDETDESIATTKLVADANGAYIANVVASIGKYSVGEYSQAYGLIVEQQQKILHKGMIFVPTTTHTERYYLDNGRHKEFYFRLSYYYVWEVIEQYTTVRGENGQTEYLSYYGWVEHADGSVAHCPESPENSKDTYLLWYKTETDNLVDDGYTSNTLYLWTRKTTDENKEIPQWVAVATLANNSSNRAVGMISQKTNEIALEVFNTRGDFAGLTSRIDDTQATVLSTTKWITGGKKKVDDVEQTYNLTAIDQSSDGDGSSIVLAVTNEEGTTKINGATITLKQSDGTSSISLSADAITIDGKFTTNGNAGFQEDGGLFARSGKIGGWSITNEFLRGEIDDINYVNIWAPNSNNSHSFINLMHNGVYTFSVSADGKLTATNADIAGKINATSGKIGGWTIDELKLFRPSEWSGSTLSKYGTGMSSTTTNGDPAFYAGFGGNGGNPWAHTASNKDGHWTNHTNFYVTNAGYLYAKNADISGIINATSGKIGGWSITNEFLRGEIDDINYVNIWAPNSNNSHSFINLMHNGVYTFSVSADGKLTATNADIAGKINATSGKFSDSVTIGDTTITAGSLRSLYNYATSGKGAAIKYIETGNGALDFSKYFSFVKKNNGNIGIQMSNNTGYFTIGDNSEHPYVSALNVAGVEAGISFRTGTSQNDVGRQVFSMGLAKDQSVTNGLCFKMNTHNSHIHIDKYRGITGQIKIPLASKTGYLAIYKGFVVGYQTSGPYDATDFQFLT